jgi:hypothetical protein
LGFVIGLILAFAFRSKTPVVVATAAPVSTVTNK